MLSAPDTPIPIFGKERLPDPRLAHEAAVYLVDKPIGWTSFRVVGLLRKLLGIKKVGHAGTLDPLATGLLIVCAGKAATKTISQYQDLIKEYRAQVTFGHSTPSYDSETESDVTAPYDHISEEDIRSCLEESFCGQISQIPPMYAAIKKDGIPLYKLARKGVEIEREARLVTIYSSFIHSYQSPVLDLSISCSKGTYIRSISHDLGIKLGSRAHMSALRRTAIGGFSVEKSLTVQELCNYLDPNGQFNLSV